MSRIELFFAFCSLLGFVWLSYYLISNKKIISIYTYLYKRTEISEWIHKSLIIYKIYLSKLEAYAGAGSWRTITIILQISNKIKSKLIFDFKFKFKFKKTFFWTAKKIAPYFYWTHQSILWQKHITFSCRPSWGGGRARVQWWLAATLQFTGANQAACDWLPSVL